MSTDFNTQMEEAARRHAAERAPVIAAARSRIDAALVGLTDYEASQVLYSMSFGYGRKVLGGNGTVVVNLRIES